MKGTLILLTTLVLGGCGITNPCTEEWKNVSYPEFDLGMVSGDLVVCDRLERSISAGPYPPMTYEVAISILEAARR